MLLPARFGGGVVRRQLGGGGNLHHAAVRQLGAAVGRGKLVLRLGGKQRRGAVGQQAGHAVVGQDFKLHFGAHYKHPQPLEHGFRQIGGQRQQDFVAGVVGQKVGDHAAFGGVVGGIAGMTGGKVVDVVGKLAVQKAVAVVADGADNGEKGQGAGRHVKSFLSGETICDGGK